MGVDTALYSGVSGLNANSNAMNVIGNNLSNSQTTGFKAERSLFSDMLASEVASAGGSSQIGRGVGLSTVDRKFSQGSFKDTGINTDMGIDGDGFFMVSDPDQEGTKYTRDGSFRFDDEGNLVNASGYRVQGYDIDEDGNVGGQLNDIHTDLSGSIEPSATTEAKFATNLNQDAELVNGGAFDIDDPNASSNFSASVNVYDSLGASHQATIYFTKMDPTTDENKWEYNLVLPAEEIDDGSDELEILGQGKAEFDADGKLTDLTADTGSDSDVTDGVGSMTTKTIEWANDSNDSKILINFNLSQYSGESSLVSKSQNGFASGTLEDVSVDKDGIITGAYSNGQSRDLAQVGLAKFANPNGLLQDGNNLFTETQASGLASVGPPGSGAGTIRSNSLEQSNVDIAEQFSDMIVTQRAYQANSRTITTSDEMLQEVINL
ncbi:MAG: flagellar hook protein FlgE, partial [Desulfovermiculus sp.]